MKQFENNAFFTLVEQELKTNKTVRFKVKGNSMYPLLRSGKDEVLLGEAENGNIREGAIVLFMAGGQHILHRLVRIYRSNDIFIFRGDNVLGNMESCSASDIVGVVTKIYRQKSVGAQINDLKGFYEVSSSSFKWSVLIALHRLYLKTRQMAGRLKRKTFK